MLSAITAAKLDHGLASLALDQLRGEAPPPGQISLEELARRSGVSPATVAKIERIALAKLARALTGDPALSSRLARALSPNR